MKRTSLILSLLGVAMLALAIHGCAVDGAAEGKVAGRASTSPEVFPWAGPESQPARITTADGK